MQIFYPQGVIFGTWVDENSLVYCAVETWTRFVRRKGYLSKQHCSCVSRAANKNVKLLDSSSFHLLNHLETYWDAGFFSPTSLHIILKKKKIISSFCRLFLVSNPKSLKVLHARLWYVFVCFQLHSHDFSVPRKKKRKKESNNSLLFSAFCSFNLLSA